MTITPVIEDYLKAIYKLQAADPDRRVSTNGVAGKMGVASASATGMLKKLASLGLVRYEPYRGAVLTEEGERAALEIIRHHRLLETFLSEVLGYHWDEVHAEAHRLEHAISEDMEERIAKLLGEPAVDPHGEPIPSREGAVAPAEDIPLTDLAAGRPARVARVDDGDADLLRYLHDLGLVLDARLEVTARSPFGGPLHVRLLDGDATLALGPKVTDHVYVVVG